MTRDSPVKRLREAGGRSAAPSAPSDRFDLRGSREMVRALGLEPVSPPPRANRQAVASPPNSARDDVDACLKALRSSSAVSVAELEPPRPKFAGGRSPPPPPALAAAASLPPPRIIPAAALCG